MTDMTPENYEILTTALANGWQPAEIFSAMQEVAVVVLAAIPPTTVTKDEGANRLLHLAMVGLLFEKGMLTERKP